MKRRDFFKIMGIASGAALSACKVNNADKKLLPYLVPPEDDIIPGVPRYVMSTCMECPAQCGVQVKIRDEKPVKLEGNPEHPVNAGALCMRGQASLARLYSPDRFLQPQLKTADGAFKPVSWDEAAKAMQAALKKNKEKRNVYLSSRTTGSLSGLIDEFCQALDMERLKEVELFNYSAIKKANQTLFGLSAIPHYRIDQSDTLITVGADILETFISPVEWARQLREGKKSLHTTWYHLEPVMSLTGASADHRAVVRPGGEAYLLAYLLHNTTPRNPLPETILAEIPNHTPEKTAELTGLDKDILKALVQALHLAKKPLIMTGGTAGAGRGGDTAALYTALLQWSLGMVNQTLEFGPAVTDENVGTLADLDVFTGGGVGNHVGVGVFSRLHGFQALPEALKGMAEADFKVAVGTTPSPVTEICDLILPLSHPLESWGDAEPRKGLQSVIQPAVKPLHDTKSEGDMLLFILGRDHSYRDYLSERWQGMGEDWINNGFKTSETKNPTLQLAAGVTPGQPSEPYGDGCLFILPSLRTFDGRGADIPLLTEIPDPLSAVSYGHYISLSPQAAKKHNVAPGDGVELKLPGGSLKLSVIINPALTGGAMTLTVDALKDINLPFAVAGGAPICTEDVKLTKTADAAKLAVLAGAQKTGNRGILPHHEHDDHAHHDHGGHSLYPPHEHKDYRWGMVIDLDACSGCSACVAACYVENNIPLVGQDEHQKGREMAWLRIEPYFNDHNVPEFLPMMCQHCDHAPCETVCPVFATYHNPEGLNAQVYNRCVGTRYCANNCPYKARRFNWSDHQDSLPLYETSNPDLSVRPKGVMEKCTFCIQRILYAKDQAKDQDRLVKDGEVTTACAQTCPSGAITFGNLMDPNSEVSKLAKSAGAYRVQEALGTQPAVYYIKREKHDKS